ncbi:DUF6310 domain-containing protein [Stigmatella sp. ncwal1]|uniref:DUF6310 domain-containing protein n=1 Tax=Stigmatella ashevillensis TaxID=2995309 RepID=A0ABT5D1R1_9BACT|nr:DUF6310 domain-containing protein [Stigmatella ashevillena]MDC0707068.1 DUF6310 domain-containing protein [Stigmatella ashevillena]
MVDPNVRKMQDSETKPKGSGSNRSPPAPLTSAPRPECIPRIVPHRGGDPLHDACADKIPQNGFPGFEALVNGKHFDALQHRAGVLWEIKTDSFDTFTAALQRIVIAKQVPELQHEREIARTCGFDFRVGVRSAAHKRALEAVDLTLKVVVMDWC